MIYEFIFISVNKYKINFNLFKILESVTFPTKKKMKKEYKGADVFFKRTPEGRKTNFKRHSSPQSTTPLHCRSCTQHIQSMSLS
jgi:hypothetical protein